MITLNEEYSCEENFQKLQEPNHKIVIVIARKPLHLSKDYTVKTLVLFIGFSAALKFTSYYTNLRLIWAPIMEVLSLVPKNQF